MKLTRALIALALVALAAGPALGKTWHIAVDGTGDAPTIKAGIDSSAVGDTVLVAPGTYTWSNQGTGNEYGMIYIERYENGFILMSEAGPEVTILDAERHGRVFFIAGMNYITIDGFTVRGGKAPAFGDYTGGGIACHLTHDLVRNCIFRDNTAQRGGAIWCGGVSTITFEDCQFFNNEAENGGAIYLINSSSPQTFRNCAIHDNTASNFGGAIFSYHDGFVIENSVIALNAAAFGGAIYTWNQWTSSVTATTIADNTAPDASAVFLTASPDVSIQRSIIARGLGGAPFNVDATSALTVSCSDVYGNAGSDILPASVTDGGDNFTGDPAFCGPAGSLIYTVAGNSPCLPGYHPGGASCGLVGAFGTGCGYVRVESATWGRVKALYR